MDVPDGWSDETIKGLWRVLPKALEWIDESFPGMPSMSSMSSMPSAAAPVTQQPMQYVVFTGVRDKALETKLFAMGGWDIQPAVTAKTDVLVVADGDFKESAKTKKATQLGVKIQTISEFRSALG
jgi:NAD-dependent DNA ligase